MARYSTRYWVHGLGAWLCLWLLSLPAGAGVLHHRLEVKLQAATASITVQDTLVFPDALPDRLTFVLRADLELSVEGANLEYLGDRDQGRQRLYRLSKLAPDRSVRMRYQGRIQSRRTHALFGMPESILSPDGVYLDAASDWYPRFDAYPWFSFDLTIDPVAGWQFINQGKALGAAGRHRFAIDDPQDDIYLLGGPFRPYTRRQGDTGIQVLLLQDDPELAARYLDASARYLAMYDAMIGAYPYASFSVVENRHQTGYGMPSFTLLGSRVLRLPFILDSSLPHEILHNWWGNGVFIDGASGNWSEGLTAYLADHLISERQGRGRDYRRKALERYADFAAQGRDIPLVEFRARHDQASQAVGYGKSLMLFHMLRRQAGAAAFDAGLQDLWDRYRFRSARFDQVIAALYGGDGPPIEDFVDQWLHRTGAPHLELGATRVRRSGDVYHLGFELAQTQPGPVYRLRVPVQVELADATAPVKLDLVLETARQAFDLDLPGRPSAISVDPDFDLFRLLDPSERPATLGRLFGAGRQWLVLPSKADPDERAAWQRLAAQWAGEFGNVELVEDTGPPVVDPDGAVWLLGWQNHWLDGLAPRLTAAGQALRATGADLAGSVRDAAQYAVVLLDADTGRAPLGFVGAIAPAVIDALARKLPHYAGYGRLAFALPGVDNVLKDSPPPGASVLHRDLVDATQH